MGGKPHGTGVKEWPNGKKYIGEFRSGKPWGVGKKVFNEG